MAMIRRHTVTTRTHDVFARAHDLADTLGHDELSHAHVMLGLLGERMNIAAQLLCSRVPHDVLERDVEARLPPAGVGRDRLAERAWTSEDDRLIDRAGIEARELGQEYIGCEHVLLAMLRDTSSVPAQVLQRHGIDYSQVREELVRVFSTKPGDGGSAPPSPAV